MLGKLHRDTIKHYECQLKNIKETETLREFLAYNEARCEVKANVVKTTDCTKNNEVENNIVTAANIVSGNVASNNSFGMLPTAMISE